MSLDGFVAGRDDSMAWAVAQWSDGGENTRDVEVQRSAVADDVLQAAGAILGGLAIVEDAHHNIARLDAVPADGMEQREEELLALAKSWMPRLPCDLDVLIVDEMGKNISGTGMDAKVVNRGPDGEYNPWPGLPSIARIFIRDLARRTYGNAMGIGMADVTHGGLVRRLEGEPTRINAVSASRPRRRGRSGSSSTRRAST